MVLAKSTFAAIVLRWRTSNAIIVILENSSPWTGMSSLWLWTKSRSSIDVKRLSSKNSSKWQSLKNAMKSLLNTPMTSTSAICSSNVWTCKTSHAQTPSSEAHAAKSSIKSSWWSISSRTVLSKCLNVLSAFARFKDSMCLRIMSLFSVLRSSRKSLRIRRRPSQTWRSS